MIKNRDKNDQGDPEELFISRASIAFEIEDTPEGQGVKYIRGDKHYDRVNELLRRNNEMLSECRTWKAEARKWEDDSDRMKEENRLILSILGFTWSAIAFGAFIAIIGLFW